MANLQVARVPHWWKKLLTIIDYWHLKRLIPFEKLISNKMSISQVVDPREDGYLEETATEAG